MNKAKQRLKSFIGYISKLIHHALAVIIILVIAIFIAIIVVICASAKFPEQAIYVLEHITFGQMIENNSKDSISDNFGNVQGDATENKLQKCDSDFRDNKWNIKGPWLRDIANNPQQFISRPDQFGGPRMEYEKPISDSFYLALDFMPIMNKNNREKEINFVVYIGDLYRIVIGDGNNKNFYLKKGKESDEYIPTLKEKYIVSEFPNEISFNEWITLNIRQSALSSSLTRTVMINFSYTPYRYGKEKLPPDKTKVYTFEINDNAPSDKVSRNLGIGLIVNNKKENTIITEFKCFKLENY